MIERWWDSIKKVIRLHRATNQAKNKKTLTKGTDIRYELEEQLDQDDDIFHFYLLLKHDDSKFSQLGLNEYELQKRLKMNRTLSFWCFNPGLGFRKMLQLDPRSIILTSGTLAPLDTFQRELLIDFPIRIENGHVIDKS